MTTDQQQEARWVLQGTEEGWSLGVVIDTQRPNHPLLSVLDPAVGPDVIRDHGQADVAEALRAENARLTAVADAGVAECIRLREALAVEIVALERPNGPHEYRRGIHQSPCNACYLLKRLKAALDAAPEEKQE